jgi:hypothetical protein
MDTLRFADIRELDQLNEWAKNMAATPMAYFAYLTLFRELSVKCFIPVLEKSELESPFRMETGHTFLTLEGGIQINGYLLIIHVLETGEHYDYCFDFDSDDPRRYRNVRLLDPGVEAIDAVVQ